MESKVPEGLVAEKSRRLLELEEVRRGSPDPRRVLAVASTVAALEVQIADHLLESGRPDDAAVSLLSAASCLVDAKRLPEAKRLDIRASRLSGLTSLREWLQRALEQLAEVRTPAAVFGESQVRIANNESLRIPQREAHAAARRHFSKSKEHAIIQLPVGCGKTGTMALLPFGLAEGRTLVVTPNLEINRTVAQSLGRGSDSSFYRRANVLDEGLGPVTAVLDADANVHDCDEADFVVTNIQQLVAGTRDKWLRYFPKDYFDLILVDEGHHNVAPSWREVFARFPAAKITSLTATPLRSDGQEVEGQRIYRFPIAEAIRDGYVRDLSSRQLQPSELYFEYAGSGRRLTLKEVFKLRESDWFSRGVALSQESNRHIVDASIQCMKELRSVSGMKHQIIGAACSIDHARAISSLYRERECNSDVIHSDMPAEDQEKVRTQLASGELDAVVHVQMLGEGADYPRLGVAAIFRPYRHMVPYVQFVGRVMRVARENSPGHPDNRAFVVTHVGLNVDRWWTELKLLDADDQLVFEQLANAERSFINEPTEEPAPRRRFRPPMEVLTEVIDRFLDVGFLDGDARALVDDVVKSLGMRGISIEDLGLSRQELEQRLLRESDRRQSGAVSKIEVQPQRRRVEARRRLDERVRAGAKELLNELGMTVVGWDLQRAFSRLGATNNLAAAVILINLEVQAYLKSAADSRDLLTVDELERAYGAMDEIVDRVATRVRDTIKGA